MRHSVLTACGSAFVAASLLFAVPARAQQDVPPMTKDDIAAFAKVQVAISLARDSIQAQLAKSGNKKDETQRQLQEKLRNEIAEILHHNGMTEQDLERKTYIVSADLTTRKVFDSVVVVLTGAPTPGQLPPAPPRPAPIKVPAGMVGTHIGHVVNSFVDTPMMNGLLPTAFAEARIAIQHAQLAMRNPTNLDQLKLHAGHVIHALDPTVVTTGPGQGYGMKKAATGVANHIELAAKVAGASPNVAMHATHVATAARSAVTRADQIIALAKQVQAASSATDAAALMNQIASLADQLVTGADTNGDGKIGWQDTEGGLQQAQEHVTLLLAGEKLP